jgi:predicted transport protein
MEFIKNIDLFSDHELNYPISESYEQVMGLMQSCGEFRAFAHPENSSWGEYVRNIFELLGFVVKRDPHQLFVLSDNGASSTPRAIAGLVQPGYSLEVIAPGLNWGSHLYFATKSYKVDWGIITNGLELFLYNFTKGDYQSHKYWVNIDGVIEEQRSDSFYKLYQVLSYIKGQESVDKETITPLKAKEKLYITMDHKFSEERLTKNKPLYIVEMYEDLRNNIIPLSNSITVHFHTQYVTYAVNGNNFCEICIQSNRLKVWLNMDINNIHDSKNICIDVSNASHPYGTGNTEIQLNYKGNIKIVADLLKQSFEYNYHHQPVTPKSRKTKDIQTGRFDFFESFWTSFIEAINSYPNAKGIPISQSVNKKYSWISGGSGGKGLIYYYYIRNGQALIDLYIDNQKSSQWNKEVFDTLLAHKYEIEANYGSDVDWRRMDDNRACRIVSSILTITNYETYDNGFWSDIHIKMIKQMILFQDAIQPFINRYVVYY